MLAAIDSYVVTKRTPGRAPVRMTAPTEGEALDRWHTAVVEEHESGRTVRVVVHGRGKQLAAYDRVVPGQPW